MKRVKVPLGLFAKAVIRAVVKKEGFHQTFLPYAVRASSFRIDVDELEVTVDEVSQEDAQVVVGKSGRLAESTEFFLSKGDILPVLAQEIDIFLFERKPCCRILSIVPDIPDDMAVRIEFMPRESLKSEFFPRFDGSLSL